MFGSDLISSENHTRCQLFYTTLPRLAYLPQWPNSHSQLQMRGNTKTHALAAVWGQSTAKAMPASTMWHTRVDAKYKDARHIDFQTLGNGP